MGIQMKDVSSFLLSILESFLQDRISSLHDKKEVRDYFNAFDESIFDMINNLRGYIREGCRKY